MLSELRYPFVFEPARAWPPLEIDWAALRDCGLVGLDI